MVSIYETITELENKHIQLIEASYHIHNSRLIRERRQLMKNGGVSSKAWIEATPIYEKGRYFSEIGLPVPVTNILNKFSENNLGVFNPPYLHQENALKAFFNNNKNLIVSTGTGSGKTEIFLYSILGSLALEAERNKTTKNRGIRAIILYPMNALVSDQLSRLRRIFGNELGGSHIEKLYGRKVQFGMYTSRTPYHGQYNVDKNDRILKQIINYYNNLQDTDVALFNDLKARGKIPAKNLKGFSNGKSRDSRYHTQPEDFELFTRQEMHSPNQYGGTPDILITNYSMLSYMLIRPIEQKLFDTTRDWLSSDKNNKLLIVIDEAHLYRGAQGAEVALLIRRLLQHLNVTQSQVRFILTSASLGADARTNEIGSKFASDLTGASSDQFSVIQGHKRKMENGSAGTIEIANSLSHVNYSINNLTIKELSKTLNWPTPPSDEKELKQYLGKCLSTTPLFWFIHNKLGQTILSIQELSQVTFPNVEEKLSIDATLNLLFLSSQAESEKNQSLMPVRLHLFYRGLPKQYACTNPNCNHRLVKDDNTKLLGKIYTEPRIVCDCGSRVFELLTHRTCGAAYLKAYRRKTDRHMEQVFLWTDSENHDDLEEIHILLEYPRADPDIKDKKSIPLSEKLVSQERYLDINTGYMVKRPPTKDERFIKVWIPSQEQTRKNDYDPWSWTRCPVCGIKENRKPNGQTNIMDLETKGEEVFANLVKTLFKFQPEIDSKKDLPNKGKKVLCFSDGRQKAARLARDLQRTVELDSFREVVAKSISELPDGCSLINLYPQILVDTSKLKINFFDDGDESLFADGSGYEGSRTRFVNSQNELPEIVTKYALNNINELIFDKDSIEELNKLRPREYNIALLRLLGDKYYSINASLVAYIVPTIPVLNNIERLNPGVNKQLLKEVIIEVLRSAAANKAFDPQINDEERRLSRVSISNPQGYNKDHEGLSIEDLIPDNIREKVGAQLTSQQWQLLASSLIKSSQSSPRLFSPINGCYVINPEAVILHLGLDEAWYRCSGCRQFFASALSGRCPECNGELKLVEENDIHLSARKSLFREPCIKVVNGNSEPITLRSEEHSAQLSNKDNVDTFSKTEEYELLFQDILINNNNEQPIDVLSCTTTMEVGIDIGSLTGVALRTVPPRPENYQQRAGRAGRRGSALSTIITFANNSPHESYHFSKPNILIGAPASEPIIYTGNRKISERHINASLIQKFFQRNYNIDINSDLFSSLGDSYSFFCKDGSYSLEEFNKWVNENVLQSVSIVNELSPLLPSELKSSLEYNDVNWRELFIKDSAKLFLTKLNKLSTETDWNRALEKDEMLLETLLNTGLLPSFSFPIDVCTFSVQEFNKIRYNIKTKYEMSQELQQALSEYAPGRQIVVDKKTYMSSGLYIPFANDPINRASGQKWDTLEWINHCDVCGTILKDNSTNLSELGEVCPICNSPLTSQNLYRPLGFSPLVDPARGVLEGEQQEQERVYATSAKYPLPIALSNSNDSAVTKALKNGLIRNMPDQELLVVNFGHDNNGYEICTQCGAIGGRNGLTNPHKRPYPIHPREKGYKKLCNGVSKPTTLGYRFRTDLVVLRVTLKAPLNLDWTNPWYSSTVKTLSEALSLGASRVLGIDNTELAGGYRPLPPVPGDDPSIRGYLDIFLYDTTPSGAGFASRTYQDFEKVLTSALDILSQCTCSKSCHNCLRTYDNRLWHNELDRYLGKALLNYVTTGTIPKLDSEQNRLLVNQLKSALELVNPKISFEQDNKEENAFIAGIGPKKVKIVIRHCLVDTMQSNQQANVFELSNYDIQHDLPRYAHLINDRVKG